MPTLQHIIEALKLAPRYLAAIAIFCIAMLTIPNGIANWLGIGDFTQHYRQWISIPLLATISLLTVYGCIYVRDTIRNGSRAAKFHERTLQRLHSLTEDEKQILRFYIAQQTKTNVLRTNDGVVNGLVASGIICLAASHGNILEGFAHNITDFAWEYLQENLLFVQHMVASLSSRTPQT